MAGLAIKALPDKATAINKDTSEQLHRKADFFEIVMTSPKFGLAIIIWLCESSLPAGALVILTQNMTRVL